MTAATEHAIDPQRLAGGYECVCTCGELCYSFRGHLDAVAKHARQWAELTDKLGDPATILAQHRTTTGQSMTDAQMTAAEFKVAREFLGLPGDWIAAHLLGVDRWTGEPREERGIDPRMQRRWEQGAVPIPAWVRPQIEELQAIARGEVKRGIEELQASGDARVLTYFSTEHYRQYHPGAIYPASWHRAIVARIVSVVDARIDFAPDLRDEPESG